MIAIGDILVSDEILSEYFACDYERCKGACCVVGESGAPLEEDEAQQLEDAWPAYSPIMTENGRKCVEAKGFFEIDRDGDMVTPLMEMAPAEREATGNETLMKSPDNPCAFAFFENSNCLCAVERTHICGGCAFKKPISCRLYPIRVIHLSDGSRGLNLHRWHLCRESFEKGRREGVKVYRFLKAPIVDAFGEEFYEQLEAAEKLLQGN